LRAWEIHGGRIDAAQAQFRDAPLPWLDLSTGINPLAWIGDAAADLRALPSPVALAGLEAAAGKMFGARCAVAALPGTEVGLRLLACLGLPGPMRHVAPSYASHARPGSTAIAIEGLEEAAEAGGTILLANPNNPDGRVLTPARLVALARTLRASGGWLVVDEAFADALPEASTVPHLRPGDPVLVFRSFGKFFGLAGLRLGFLLGPEPQVAAMRGLLGSWPVSSMGIAIGTAAYADATWIGATRMAVQERAVALDTVLARHGLVAQGACPLFRLVETDADALFARLARAGILTRPFAYDPRWLRLGVPGDAQDLDRLDRALG